MTMTLSELADKHNVLVLEPRSTYDRALVAVEMDVEGGPPRAVYSGEACVQAVMDAQGWAFDEAVEWVDFNVVGACVGAGYPLIVWRGWFDDEK